MTDPKQAAHYLRAAAYYAHEAECCDADEVKFWRDAADKALHLAREFGAEDHVSLRNVWPR